MSLPPALLERLKRRGIIKDAAQDESKKQDAPQTNHSSRALGHEANTSVQNEQGEEEILAADYSDEDHSEDEDDYCDGLSDSEKSNKDKVETTRDPDDRRQHMRDDSRVDEISETSQGPEEQIECILGCPNKYNIYHTCSRYCKDRYGQDVQIEPSKESRKLLAILLRASPLPPEWKAVYEPGVETFYFWNVMTNQVSWYPPGVGAFACPPAEYIRAMMKIDQQQLILAQT